MAITEYYVDPSIAANTGSGTVGDPYGDLQHALDTVTRNTTDGDRFNIKSGTAELLTAEIDLTSYGTPTSAARLYFQGYTSSQGDRGIGEISANGSGGIWNDTTTEYVVWMDLKIGNTGPAKTAINCDTHHIFINVEIYDATNHGIEHNSYCLFHSCRFSNCGNEGLNTDGWANVYGCVFEDGANDFVRAFSHTSRLTSSQHNIFICDAASRGLYTNTAEAQFIRNNTVYWTDAGTGTGFDVRARPGHMINNYAEGLSGAGGKGFNGYNNRQAYTRANRYYNNTVQWHNNYPWIDTDNSATTASGLTNPGTDDYTATTELRGAGWPTAFRGISTDQFWDIGAAQRTEDPPD